MSMYILDTEQLLNKEGEIQMNNPFSLLRNKEIIAILDGDTKYGDYEWFISEDPYIPEVRKEVS